MISPPMRTEKATRKGSAEEPTIWGVVVPPDLVDAIEREKARREKKAGVKIGRSELLRQLLREALNG